MAEYVGVTAADTGCVRIFKFEGGNLDKFVIEDRSVEGLNSALKDFLDGKLKAYYKS